MNSNPNDPDLIIDPFIDAINNVLVVTGALTIYAPNNITVWTRLSSYASAGATQITVLNAANWRVGDQIVLGPSGRSAT